MMKKYRKYRKAIALTITVGILAEVIAPLRAFAITGHSSMPEYRSFEPVATTNMVNNFDGSFTYNIPLLEIPNGYPVSLSYHSNEVNNEALSSWVGLGWTLNPGSINRVKRGFPDEFNGEEVTYHNRMEPNWTVSAGPDFHPEIFGGEKTYSANLGATLRYNNYNGIGTSVTGGINLAGVSSLNFNYTDGQFGFSPEVNPGALFHAIKNGVNNLKSKNAAAQGTSDKTTPETKKPFFRQSPDQQKSWLKQSNSKVQFGISVSGDGYGASAGYASGKGFSSNFSLSTFPGSPMPVTTSKYMAYSGTVKVDVGVNFLPLPIAPEGSITGSFVWQENEPIQTIKTYGYMHSEKALAEDESMMDYNTENDTPFEKRDNVLGIPVPNNDIFNMSGEAIGGSFKPIRSEFGHYRKNKVKSETISGQLGADVKIASVVPILIPLQLTNFEYSAGADLGGDYQSLVVSKWDNHNWSDANRNLFESAYNFKDDSYFSNSNEKFFLRFSGDLGGSFDLSGKDDAYKAKLDWHYDLTASPDFTSWSNNYGVNTSGYMDQRSNKQRGTYIDFSTIKDYSSESNGKRYKVAERNLKIGQYVSDQFQVVSYNYGLYENDGIGEYVTHNPDGVQYVYGLPVHCRNEKELNYSLKSSDINKTDFENAGGGLIAQITSDIDGTAKRKLGYESDSKYATTHLLTQINSPDYIDRTYNGPSEDDFGSYSSFNYVKISGGSGTWYPYRSPYKGVNYNYGSLSINDDDMGSFSYGEKETYFMHSIASKTHVAIFTLDDREDGLGARLASSPTKNNLIKGDDGTSPQKLKRLSKIELYAIEDADKIDGTFYKPKTGKRPIKTIHFEYDYSLCGNIPNNSGSLVEPGNSNKGKLTLKKIWFEYNGALTSKISPYIFDYNYPTNVDYTSKYASLKTEFDVFSSSKQNPSYNVLNSDRWGNFRDYSDMKSHLGDLARFFPFNDQNPSANVDLAAWCMKKITLPSGGEIHVQYEPNDYQFVQDKRAMMMVPLSTNTGTDETVVNGVYYLDLSKVGIDLSSATLSQKITAADDLFAPMRDEKQRIYFNFLYSIMGSSPNFTSTNSDYVEGYARISGYGVDSQGRAYFKFKSDEGTSQTADSFYRKIEYNSNVSSREMPRQVCLNFFKTQRRGKISGEDNVLKSAAQSGSGKDLVMAFANMMKNLGNAFSDKCAAISPQLSYVRVQVPLIKKKLGGGVRVRRILMYDEGVKKDTDPNSLYGQEFTYTTNLNGVTISSGVASNEPGVGRRESPLVNPIEKDAQSSFSAILYGRDMYSQEGPLGESLLPAPSIGYSQVTIKNIHSGKTSTGTEVHEFYTWKDFPFKVSKTHIEQVLNFNVGASGGVNIKNVGIGAQFSRKAPYLSQGYSFITNAMNGKPKRTAKYAHLSSSPMAEEIYEYYKPGEKMSVMDEKMVVTQESIGKESEMLSEQRQIADVSVGGSLGADVSGTVDLWAPPPPFVAPVVTYSLTGLNVGFRVNEQVMHTHVTTKVISYPAIVKRVINSTDGIRNISENMVFDKFSGNPVVVKSYDDFKKGTYFNQDIMASWNYENLRSKSINQKVKSSAAGINYVKNSSGSFVQFSSYSGCSSELAKFRKGDFIEIPHTESQVGLFHVDEVDYVNNRLRIIPSKLNSLTLSSKNNISVIVLRSGNTNQLNAKSGNILFHQINNNYTYISASPFDASVISNDLLIADLNNQLKDLTSGEGTITLSNTYDHVSMKNYASSLPTGCVNNPGNMSIKNVQIKYKIQNERLSLKLLSFDVSCNGTNSTVNTCQNN